MYSIWLWPRLRTKEPWSEDPSITDVQHLESAGSPVARTRTSQPRRRPAHTTTQTLSLPGFLFIILCPPGRGLSQSAPLSTIPGSFPSSASHTKTHTIIPRLGIKRFIKPSITEIIYLFEILFTHTHMYINIYKIYNNNNK